MLLLWERVDPSKWEETQMSKKNGRKKNFKNTVIKQTKVFATHMVGKWLLPQIYIKLFHNDKKKNEK